MPARPSSDTTWLLDDSPPDNGALRLVPGSHRRGKVPQEALADPTAADPGQVLVTGRAGSVVVLNAHTWRAGTANRTGGRRTSLHAFYCRRDKPQQQQRLLRPEVERSLPPQLRHLLALDDPLNDKLSEQVAVRSGFLN